MNNKIVNKGNMSEYYTVAVRNLVIQHFPNVAALDGITDSLVWSIASITAINGTKLLETAFLLFVMNDNKTDNNTVTTNRDQPRPMDYLVVTSESDEYYNNYRLHTRNSIQGIVLPSNEYNVLRDAMKSKGLQACCLLPTWYITQKRFSLFLDFINFYSRYIDDAKLFQGTTRCTRKGRSFLQQTMSLWYNNASLWIGPFIGDSTFKKVEEFANLTQTHNPELLSRFEHEFQSKEKYQLLKTFMDNYKKEQSNLSDQEDEDDNDKDSSSNVDKSLSSEEEKDVRSYDKVSTQSETGNKNVLLIGFGPIDNNKFGDINDRNKNRKINTKVDAATIENFVKNMFERDGKAATPKERRDALRNLLVKNHPSTKLTFTLSKNEKPTSVKDEFHIDCDYKSSKLIETIKGVLNKNTANENEPSLLFDLIIYDYFWCPAVIAINCVLFSAIL